MWAGMDFSVGPINSARSPSGRRGTPRRSARSSRLNSCVECGSSAFMLTASGCGRVLRGTPVEGNRYARVAVTALECIGTRMAAPFDPLTPAERSERMARVRSTNTVPERRVRRILTRLGYRYRLHYARLPGRPDVAFPGRKKVVWVHGCFWHRHPECSLARMPKSRTEFWKQKFDKNRRRDLEQQADVRSRGWDALVVWECELSDEARLSLRLKEFLDDDASID